MDLLIWEADVRWTWSSLGGTVGVHEKCVPSEGLLCNSAFLYSFYITSSFFHSSDCLLMPEKGVTYAHNLLLGCRVLYQCDTGRCITLLLSFRVMLTPLTRELLYCCY